MNALSHIALALCYLSVAVTVLSLFLPQKRTRKIFSFVIGLFIVCCVITCFRNQSAAINDGLIRIDPSSVPEADPEGYDALVKQKTAENLVAATDEILRAEGITVNDIRISLKISDEGRIYAEDVVIYISEDDLLRKSEISSIIYRNLSKEPRIYVEKETSE